MASLATPLATLTADADTWFVFRNGVGAEQTGFLRTVDFEPNQLARQDVFEGVVSTTHDLFVGGHPVVSSRHAPGNPFSASGIYDGSGGGPSASTDTAVGVSRVFVGPYVDDAWFRDHLLFGGLHYTPATATTEFVTERGHDGVNVVPDMLFDFGRSTCLFPGAPRAVKELLLSGVDAAMAMPGHVGCQQERPDDSGTKRAWTFRPWLYLFKGQHCVVGEIRNGINWAICNCIDRSICNCINWASSNSKRIG